MAEYHLLTTWRIEAPLADVYAAIRDSLRWPDWWPGAEEVEMAAAGAADGVDSVWRYAWQGPLPYRVVFDVCATRVEEQVIIEGIARGDLEGTGRWLFSRQGTVSMARCEWQVRSTRWWMNLIAPIARSMFIRNHARIMARGGQGLARLLGAPLVSQDTIDLMAVSGAPQRAHGPRRERGRIDPAMALTVGLGAGAIVAAVQLVLWWLAEMPLPQTFFRDTRLTAALLMGSGVLPPPSTLRWDVVIVAALIHFALAIAYATIPAHWAGRLRTGPALLAGACYGLLIYAVNLHGLTLLFPWFAQARDWVTVVAHLVFGVVLVEGCRLYRRSASTG